MSAGSDIPLNKIAVEHHGVYFMNEIKQMHTWRYLTKEKCTYQYNDFKMLQCHSVDGHAPQQCIQNAERLPPQGCLYAL